MKLAIRTFVVVLALTGVAASAKTPLSHKTTGKPNTPMVRIPNCDPNDPDACGVRPW